MIIKKIQIYILSRDRPNYLRQALSSLICQVDGAAQLIVSDNSDGDEVNAMMANDFPSIDYIRRNPVLTPQDHFLRVINECTGQYISLFHDDDYAAPTFLRSIISCLDKDLTLGAVGSNAWIVRGETKTREKFMSNFSHPLRFENPKDLIARYLQFLSEGVAPFPSYIYRRKYLQGLMLDYSIAGKYSDVTLLASLLQRAPILWLPQPLLNYRIHSANDSACDSIGQRLKLLRFVQSHLGFEKDSNDIREYKYKYWSRWYSESRLVNDRCHSKRYDPARRFLLLSKLKFITSIYIWIRLVKKIRIKIWMHIN